MQLKRKWLLLILALLLASQHGAVQAVEPPFALQDMLLDADARRIGGNYPAAIEAYRQILAQAGPSPSDEDLPIVRSATYRLAQTYALDNNLRDAATNWQQFLDHYPSDPRRALALLQLANAQREQKNYVAAFAAYQSYRVAAPSDDLLAPYVSLALGQAYFDAGQFALAQSEFANAANAPGIPAGMRVLANQKLGEALNKSGDLLAAVQAFDAALKEAQTKNTRSQLDVAAARALKEMGNTDEAIARLKRVLGEAPEGDAAPQAVEELVKLAPRGFNYFQAGLAYYNRKRWDAAVNWFHRYLDEQNDLDLAHYYAARAFELNGQQDRAIREWTVLITTHPTSDQLTEAWYERADDYHRLGNDAMAIKQYQQLAATYPASKWAEEALFASAVIYDMAGKYTDAAKQYEATQAAYPGGARASESLMNAGLARVRANDFTGAKAALEKMAALYPQSSWRSKALFWLGKIAQKQGRPADAQTRWLEAYRTNPSDYYGMRALDTAHGSLPTGAAAKNFSLPISFPGEQRVMEQWLREWAIPSDEWLPRRSLSVLRAEIAYERAWQRGKLLLEVGMRAEGKAELRALAERYRNDPIAQYQLALALRELGLYDASLQVAYRIYTAAPEKHLSETPEFLQRLIYPVPYAQLVVNEAQKNGFDPLLYYGLIWQESQFDAGGTSVSVARGLTQVMPGTGQGIASALKKPTFQVTDLYKPYISLEFGAYYFGVQYKNFDKDYMMSAAGYNGGPGNALKWKAADVDMAVENVSLSETRVYVRRVYQHHWYYRHLYGDESRTAN